MAKVSKEEGGFRIYFFIIHEINVFVVMSAMLCVHKSLVHTGLKRALINYGYC